MIPTPPGTAEGGDGWRQPAQRENEVKGKEGDTVLEETFSTCGMQIQYVSVLFPRYFKVADLIWFVLVR